MPLLTIIIPVYIEESTIAQVIESVETVQLPNEFTCEIIIVNDGSTDYTHSILQRFEKKHKVILSENTGKGGAVRKGFQLAKGDFIIVQDADLEQNPNDFFNLLIPILNGQADVVFGSRFLGNYRPVNLIMNTHYLINKFFTLSCNFFTGFSTSDVWTGYKMYSRHALQRILPHLKANGIEFELEVTILLGKSKLKICDVPVSYHPRWYDEGKKTNWKQAIYSYLKLIEFYFRGV